MKVKKVTNIAQGGNLILYGLVFGRDFKILYHLEGVLSYFMKNVQQLP